MEKSWRCLTNQNRLCNFLENSNISVRHNFFDFLINGDSYFSKSSSILPFWIPTVKNQGRENDQKIRFLISLRLSPETEVLSSKWVKATKTTLMKLWWVITLWFLPRKIINHRQNSEKCMWTCKLIFCKVDINLLKVCCDLMYFQGWKYSVFSAKLMHYHHQLLVE